MVRSATSYSANGLRDWLVQRVSAVVLAIYSIFLIGFFVLHSPVTYAAWSALFAHTWMKVFTLLTLASLVMHAWVGVWTILTDYIKLPCLRVFLRYLLF